jgi:hypothetical protein
MAYSKLNDVEQRLEKGLRNKMPLESKYMFVGELSALSDLSQIKISDYERLIKRLGFTKKELAPFTTYLMFGEIEPDED